MLRCFIIDVLHFHDSIHTFIFCYIFFRCVVWTGDGRCFFYNPSQRQSVWEKPEDLQNRPDVDKLLANKPDPKGGKNTLPFH